MTRYGRTKTAAKCGKALAISLGLLAVPALSTSAPARADFTVCNETAKSVTVAYGYIDHDGKYVSMGWRKLGPSGDCDMLIPSGDTDDPNNYFSYAHGGGLEWQGDGPSLCTAPQRFVFVHDLNYDLDAARCRHMGGQLREFVHTESPSGNTKLHLREQGRVNFD